jgi:hypothetical protein
MRVSMKRCMKVFTMFKKQFSANQKDSVLRLRSVRKPLLKYLLGLIVYVTFIVLLFLLLRPNPTLWLFDDRFVVRNELLYYVDFRPGYPPLGKLPYIFLHNNDEGILLYHLITYKVLLAMVYKLLKCITDRRRTSILVSTVAFYPPLLLATLYIPHADLLALLWLLISIYFIIKGNPVGVGVFISLGFLTKFYNIILLLPALLLFRGWGRVALLSSFLATFFTISAPFLVVDPLMYASTYTHHLYRGPSESLFALLDGYFSHTGFHHPTYEAAIYSWQFAALYNPSNLDHFRYAWNYPQLRYVSLTLQIMFITLFSLISITTNDRAKMLKAVLFASLSYFTFSAFWNPLIAIPFFVLIMLITLDLKMSHQMLVLAGFYMVDVLHYLVWFPGLLLDTRLSLLVVVVLRAVLTSLTLYVAAGGRRPW